MIQFNLLPDVKLEFMRAQRFKHLMLTVSFISSAVALGVLVLALSSVYVVQKKAMNDLNNDIATNSATLKNTPNISDILTVQSQLNSLSALNNQKPVASRLFGYLAKLTPKKATISDLQVNYSLNTMTISGNAPSLDVVNTFIDGLKFTSYTTTDSAVPTPAFSAVVLSAFSRSSKTATYSITLSFDPAIFNTTKDVTLTVSGQDSTTNPSVIFKKGS
jgi:hypothetical protein